MSLQQQVSQLSHKLRHLLCLRGPQSPLETQEQKAGETIKRAQAYLSLLEEPSFTEVFLPNLIGEAEGRLMECNDATATEAELRSVVANLKYAKEVPTLMLSFIQQAIPLMEGEKGLDKPTESGS